MKRIGVDAFCCKWTVTDFEEVSIHQKQSMLSEMNQYLESLKTEDRVLWALSYMPESIVLSSSFGIQSPIILHLITRYYPKIPVVLIDTGYLFPETYQFIDRLTEKMQLNLCVFRPKQSAAWQEARYGKLWEQGVAGIKRYNFINKVLPMIRALKILKAGTWFSGLRRSQSSSRSVLPIISIRSGIFKFLPIVDWNNHKVFQYMKKHSLQCHPLQEQGYVSVGDFHTSRKWEPGMKEEETRFFGLQRECGLHLID